MEYRRGKIRKFDGKNYNLDTTHYKKSEADKRANELRKRGYNCRVIDIVDENKNKQYGVWKRRSK